MSDGSADWQSNPLVTDLYQLTMLQAYFDHGMRDTAVFEFSARRLPPQRNFLMAAGLEQVLGFLESLAFADPDIAALGETGLFSADFLTYLRTLRFEGDVDALPEGTIFFADEPVLRVSAPLPQAQLVESRLINILHYQTLIASKAARCTLAAAGQPVVDFGMRRAHGSEAAVLAARATYLAGFAGTATVLAGVSFGIPLYGTMAHSFIQAHDKEADAFEHFARSHRGSIVMLIDTYDTETGARRVAELSRRLAHSGIDVQSVRLDSGNLDALSRRVRVILDEGGCARIGIFASGGLDEHAIDALVRAEAPIDGFGVGTAVDVSADAPALDCVYKLQAYAGVPRRKRSSGKSTLPGARQIFRRLDDTDMMVGDTLTVLGDELAGTALLEPVMRQGRRVEPAEPLTRARERAAEQLARLPEPLRNIRTHADYSVEISARLADLVQLTDARFE